jgi:hypothetical protein
MSNLSLSHISINNVNTVFKSSGDIFLKLCVFIYVGTNIENVPSLTQINVNICD